MKKSIFRRTAYIVFLASLMILVCSCGKGKEKLEGAESKESGNVVSDDGSINLGQGILPARATIIADEEEVQNKEYSYEATLFSDRMFWGEWVRRDSSQDNESETNNRIEIESEGLDFSLDCFPEAFNLGTLKKVTLSSGEEYAKEYDCGTYGELGFNGEITTKDNDVVLAYNTAHISAFDRPDGDYSFDCVYHIKDDTLAFGIMEPNPEAKKGDSFPLTEIDYRFEWKGAYLTLYLGDTSMIYTPAFYKQSGNKMLIDNTTRIAGTESDNPLEHIILSEDNSIIEHQYNIPISVQISSPKDGVLEVEDAIDGEYSLDIYYAGRTVTVKEDDSLTILRNGRAEGNYISSRGSMNAIDPPVYSDGKTVIKSFVGEKVKNLVAEGRCSLDIDTEFLVQSAQIAKFDGTVNGNPIHYKAINRYEKAAPLTECTICAEQIDKDSGNISIVVNENSSSEERYIIGESDYVTVKEYPGDIYSVDKKRIIYKYENKQLIGFNLSFDMPYGYEVIDHSFEKEIVFLFENDVLTAYSIDIPDYIYGGLQNNVDQGDLMDMNESQMNNVIDIRDSVLAKLIEAFDASDVNVEIEPNSGLIRMNNDILFDTNKYDVKPEGAEYINQVLGVISGVVLDSDVRECIDKIEIGGHCDVRGDYESNYVLSVKRAEAVKESFITGSTALSDAQKSQLSDLLITEGYSFSSPIFDEEGKPDNDKSRRVEVKIYVNINASVPAGLANSSGNELNLEGNSSSYAGSITGSTYKNDWFGYSFTLPDGWDFASEQDLYAANNNTTIEDAINSGNNDVYIMYAEGNSDTELVGSMLCDLGGTIKPDADLDTFIELFHDALMQDYSSRKNFKSNLSKIKFCGSTISASEMEYIDDNGNQIYHKIIYLIKGDVMDIIHVISDDKNRCDEICNSFH